MATYIALARFTQQGIEKIKESPDRFDAAKQGLWRFRDFIFKQASLGYC